MLCERRNDHRYMKTHTILGATSTLWHSPLNVLARNLDVAEFAMDAILRESLGLSAENPLSTQHTPAR